MSAERGDPAILRLAEIFVSIQGESTFVGLPCTFVRLAGCNLRCAWCDTPEAQHGGVATARAAVLAQALSHATTLVEITGGEPLLQPGCRPLVRELCDAGRIVLVETNGTCELASVDERAHRIVDVKPPSSGCADHNRFEQLAALGQRDEVKFVLADREDYDFARRVIAERGLGAGGPALLLSCVWGRLDPSELCRWVLADRLPVRVQVQLHKVIWGPDARGV